MRLPARPGRDSAAAPRLVSQLLGEVAFTVNGNPLKLANRKSRALLACLCLAETGSESRERLVGLLWSETEPERARASMRQAIYEIRRRLEAANFSGFVSDNLSVRIDLSVLTCDVT